MPTLLHSHIPWMILYTFASNGYIVALSHPMKDFLSATAPDDYIAAFTLQLNDMSSSNSNGFFQPPNDFLLICFKWVDWCLLSPTNDLSYFCSKWLHCCFLSSTEWFWFKRLHCLFFLFNGYMVISYHHRCLFSFSFIHNKINVLYSWILNA